MRSPIGQRVARVVDTARRYVLVQSPKHPRADARGYVREHVLVVERAMGRFLGRSHPIHHVDGDATRNEPGNLVACENQAYHRLLHQRTDALHACGDAGFRKCLFCKKWDDPSVMQFNPHSASVFHRDCLNAYNRKRLSGVAS